MADIGWTLPPSPDHKLYKEICAEIELAEREDPIQAMLMFRTVCEADFWFFVWQVSSLGEFRIKDKRHRSFGKLWVCEPFLFDACREVQQLIEKRVTSAWLQWFRHSFKTTLVKCGCIWILSKDCLETISVHTHKVDQVGENMGRDLKNEIEKNEELRRHWPQFRNLQESSDTRIVLDRPLGPKDPSISIHPILGSTASMHPTRIIVDDAVVDRIAASVELMSQVDSQIKNLVALRGDDTPMLFVGTPWGPKDPLVVREREGVFNVVSRRPAHVDGKPQLRSEEFFREQRRLMRDDYLYMAQYELQVIARGDRYFLESWLQRYPQKPIEKAKGMHIYLVVDVANGGDESDSTVVLVLGVDHRKHVYALDLWVEKIGLTDLCDLLYGCAAPADYAKTENSWKPIGGLIRRWKAVDKQLELWIEEFGAGAWVQAVKNAKPKDLAVNIRRIPGKTGQAVRKKPRRISLLQVPFRQGEIWLPHCVTDSKGKLIEGGFGHGSHRGRGGEADDRDTLIQFLEDEFGIWTMAYGEKADAVDNMLDCFAWPFQPELQKLIRFPVAPANVVEFAAHKVNRGGHGFAGSPDNVSWQAY